MEPASKRLLVVDDEDTMRDLFKVTMETAGFTVAAAADGSEGLRMAQSYQPHLIVLDLMMPGLDGSQVLSRLQTQGLGDIPVIVVTAYSQKMSEELIRREPNVVDFVRKPIDYDKLAARIRSLLGFADGQAAAA